MNSLTIWSYEPGWEFYITCVVSSATRHGYWTGQNKNQKLCMHVLIIPDPLSSVEFSWPWFDPSSFSLLDRVGHVSSKYLVPHHKKGLWKVVLVAIELMVNVMISTVVAEQCLEDVTRKPQPAMIIHCLNGSKGEKEYGCPWSHTRDKKWECATNGVQNKALERMVVKSSKGIRDYKSVVLWMDVLIQKLVNVHVSVHEVLPCVHNNHCSYKLQHYHKSRRLFLSSTTLITNDLWV